MTKKLSVHIVKLIVTLLAALQVPATASLTEAVSSSGTEKVSTAQTGSGDISGRSRITAIPGSEKKVEIVLLMDSSGSMKKTDPRGFRKDAAKLFLSLLGKDDSISIMSFGDTATLLLPLTENSARNRKELFSAVEEISSREFSTNILDAVQKGYDQLRTSKESNRIMVMMSDGKLALGAPEKDAAAQAGLARLLPEIEAEGIKLYTVAFTEESDGTLLENIARETGGSFRYARTDKDIHAMFASIFETLKTPEQVPWEGESFVLDKDIREAVVLITKKPGTAVAIRTPKGSRFTALRHPPSLQWHASNVFDMITISEPQTGTWTVQFSTLEGNRVYVLTDLSLKSAINSEFFTEGESVRIETWLEKQGVIVTEQNVTGLAAFTAEITGPDGKSAAAALVNDSSLPARTGNGRAGIYSLEFRAAVPGEHIVKIRAAGKTFQREKRLVFRVTAPPLPVKKQEPPPAVAAAKTLPQAIPWHTVLVRFGIINFVLGILIAIAYAIVKRPGRKR